MPTGATIPCILDGPRQPTKGYGGSNSVSAPKSTRSITSSTISPGMNLWEIATKFLDGTTGFFVGCQSRCLALPARCCTDTCLDSMKICGSENEGDRAR